MNISNLPIAGATPQGVFNEHKQRSYEFKALENAIRAGDFSGAEKALDVLQQNTTNRTQATQNSQQFGYDNRAGKDFEVLANAIKSGDQASAEQAFAKLKKDFHRAGGAHERPSVEAPDAQENPPVAAPTTPTAGVNLDTLA